MSWSFYGFWSRILDAFRWLFRQVDRRIIQVQNALIYPVRWAELTLHRSFGVPMDYTRFVLAVLAALACVSAAAIALLLVSLRDRK